MRMSRIFPVACVALASLVCACSKKLTAEAIESSPAAIAQEGPHGTSAWIVGSDGTVSATLKPRDGKPIAEPVTGRMTFAAPTPDGAPTSVPVKYDPATGVLTAAGPKLEADITPVSYALTVNGKPWNGVLDVPPGGTPDLALSGKLQAALPPRTIGPNGGVVQMVGEDRVELVANRRTGDVRAYVLDTDNRPVDPGDRKISIALQGESPEILVLAPEPQAHFFVGHLRTRVDPTRMTVVVNERGMRHACLVGWSPGTVVVIGPEAPRLHLLAVDDWGGEVELRERHGHHREGVVVAEPGVVVGGPSLLVEAPVFAPPAVVVGAPGVVVGGPTVVLGGGVDVGRGHDREHDRGGEGGGRHGR
jgi:hypothetical protein